MIPPPTQYSPFPEEPVPDNMVGGDYGAQGALARPGQFHVPGVGLPGSEQGAFDVRRKKRPGMDYV